MALTKLFESCRIGKLEIRNHIIMPPMTTNFARDGFVTEQMKTYYEARAKGGVGAIIVEDAIVESTLGRHLGRDIYIDDDKFLPGLSELVNCIKAHGTRAIQHINHGGARAGRTVNGYLDLTSGKIPVAPSSVAWGVGCVTPKALSIDEIEDLINLYAAATLRAKQAGFDGVGFHCTHGYLINQFLSPTFNKRDDEYGKNAEGRLRFLLRVIEESRKRVGPDYTLMCRISGEEPSKDGPNLEEMKSIARRLEQAGIQAILLSRGSAGAAPTSSKFIGSNAPMRLPRGCMVYLAEAMKRAVKIPVIAVNRINDPVLAEEILQNNRADMIAMGRALLADPELPNKAREGRLSEIRTCIACHCCLDIMHDTPVTCAINVQVGREKQFDLGATTKPKNIFIVGGGPAGMEAARVAAYRGHKVTLYESEPKLGGQLLLASLPPGKDEINTFRSYLESELARLGVKVKAGFKVTFDQIKKMSPDVIILATGSKPRRPAICGIKKDHVMNAAEVLSRAKDVTGKVVVIGGGMVGAEVAEYLATRGSEVTVIEMLQEIASDMPEIPRSLLILALKENNVKIITNARVEEITDNEVVFIKRGQQVNIPADSVVVAMGSEPERSLQNKLDGQSVIWIGDSVKPRKILDAVKDGFEVGAMV